MNHQPFETWILDGNPETAENKELLKEHLKGCSQCARLQTSWQEVQRQVVTTPAQKAPKFFVSTWQSNLVLFKENQKRKDAKTLLFSLIGSAVMVLIALGAILLPKISLISVIVTISSAIVRIIESVKQIWSLLLSLMKVAPTTTLIVIGAMLAGWILLVVAAWGVSVWKVSLKKVVEK